LKDFVAKRWAMGDPASKQECFFELGAEFAKTRKGELSEFGKQMFSGEECKRGRCVTD